MQFDMHIEPSENFHRMVESCLQTAQSVESKPLYYLTIYPRPFLVNADVGRWFTVVIYCISELEYMLTEKYCVCVIIRGHVSIILVVVLSYVFYRCGCESTHGISG